MDSLQEKRVGMIVRRSKFVDFIFIQAILLAIVSISIFILNYFSETGFLQVSNFSRFDSAHYLGIAKNGYVTVKSVAFFPLFPYLWRCLNSSVALAMLINGFIFISFSSWLGYKFDFSRVQFLVVISLPSSCFYFIPYSESVFFAAATVLIIGLKESNLKAVLFGLFLSSLARPAFTVVIPALFIMEAYRFNDFKGGGKRSMLYVLAAASGLLVVVLIQYSYTDEWFTCFTVQSLWDNRLRLPTFPLTTWGAGQFSIYLDGAALLIGAISGGHVVQLFVRRYFGAKKKFDEIPSYIILSLAYTAGISLSVLFFRGGALFSLNRFVFAVPFIFILFHYYWHIQITIRQKVVGTAFLGLIAFWMLFGAYFHIQFLLKFIGLTVYLILYLFIKSPSSLIRKTSISLIILTNSVFLIWCLYRILHNEWVA